MESLTIFRFLVFAVEAVRDTLFCQKMNSDKCIYFTYIYDIIEYYRVASHWSDHNWHFFFDTLFLKISNFSSRWIKYSTFVENNLSFKLS